MPRRAWSEKALLKSFQGSKIATDKQHQWLHCDDEEADHTKPVLHSPCFSFVFVALFNIT
jgi:hypothetical protein